MLTARNLLLVIVVLVVAGTVYFLGYSDGQANRVQRGSATAHAAETQPSVASPEPSGHQEDVWSPTKRYPTHEAYYPGTEELKPDEMRVIACGSGMPMPRVKQAAASFLI